MSHGRDAPPGRDLDLTGMDDVDPRKACYDGSKTIDYRTRQPGTAANLQNKDALKPGLSSGVFWESDGPRPGRHVGDREFGYDSNGYLCNLGHQQGNATRREIEEHIFKSEIATPPWAKQRFGKELRVLSSKS
ncbi:hypothetical protein OQA88_11264 [Cercophora sp. LCS_1]